jgi:hypothetical protein
VFDAKQRFKIYLNIIKMAGGIQPNTFIEWLESQKGQPLLSIDGYFFTNSGKGRTAGVRYWKCSAFKTHNCLVSAKTDDVDVTNLSGVQNAPDHGHVNDAAQTKSLEVRVCLQM